MQFSIENTLENQDLIQIIQCGTEHKALIDEYVKIDFAHFEAGRDKKALNVFDLGVKTIALCIADARRTFKILYADRG